MRVRKSAEYPRTRVAKLTVILAAATTAVPLILTLNSVLTTSKRADGRFIKHRLNIDRVRARPPTNRSRHAAVDGGGTTADGDSS